jgi:hypothetical protein
LVRRDGSVVESLDVLPRAARMFEIFGSAITAVNDFESRLWTVKVAESEGLGLPAQDSPCAAL